MKKLTYFILFSFIPMFTFAQIDVVGPDGNVGIGTETPLAKLHIKGPSSINIAPLGVILEDAKLGIGVTTSLRPLHVRSDNAVIQIDRNTNSAGLIFSRYNTDYSQPLKSFGFFANATAGEFDEGYIAFTDFHDNIPGGSSDRRFVLDNDGSMIVNGVGVNDTEYTLHVFGSAAKTDGLSEWTVLSDKRLKKNIKAYKEGLDLILKIDPVSYKYNGKGGTKDNTERVGVIAQELQKVAPLMVAKHKHIDSGDNGVEYIDGIPEGLKFNKIEEEYLSINTSNLKWILVNAVKEQQEIIESQKEEISDLEERLSKIEVLLNNLQTSTASQTIELGTSSKLLQNQPNPFHETTVIKYTLPRDARNAIMQITDMNGRILRTVQLENIPKGEVTIKAKELNAGTYSYSLIVDGVIINTKQMILTE